MGKFKKVEEGMQFGKLKVISKSDCKKWGVTHWNCKCECGNECVVNTSRLNDGRRKDCGCVAKEKNKYKDLIDIKGMKFGRLTVLGKDEDYKGNGHKWKCICDCGNYKSAFGRELRIGNVKSCGCGRFKSPVTYLEKEDYFIGIDKNNRQFYFDKDDFDLVTSYQWYLNEEGYVKGSWQGEIISLHNIIKPPPNDIMVDHINGDPFDNRKSNLRFADKFQNAINRRIKATDTSGYTGVAFNKKGQVWKAYIGFRKRNIYLGSFRNIEDAIESRRKAEELYHGEFSATKSRNIT